MMPTNEEWKRFIKQSWTKEAKQIIAYFQKEYLIAEKAALRWALNHGQLLGVKKCQPINTHYIKKIISKEDFGTLYRQYTSEQTNPLLQKKARAQRIIQAIHRQAASRFHKFKNELPNTPYFMILWGLSKKEKGQLRLYRQAEQQHIEKMITTESNTPDSPLAYAFDKYERFKKSFTSSR